MFHPNLGVCGTENGHPIATCSRIAWVFLTQITPTQVSGLPSLRGGTWESTSSECPGHAFVVGDPTLRAITLELLQWLDPLENLFPSHHHQRAPRCPAPSKHISPGLCRQNGKAPYCIDHCPMDHGNACSFQRSFYWLQLCSSFLSIPMKNNDLPGAGQGNK